MAWRCPLTRSLSLLPGVWSQGLVPRRQRSTTRLCWRVISLLRPASVYWTSSHTSLSASRSVLDLFTDHMTWPKTITSLSYGLVQIQMMLASDHVNDWLVGIWKLYRFFCMDPLIDWLIVLRTSCWTATATIPWWRRFLTSIWTFWKSANQRLPSNTSSPPSGLSWTRWEQKDS